MRAKGRKKSKKAADPAIKKSRGVTRQEAARALGVPPNRISQWVSDGAPVVERGRRGIAAIYDVDALRAWKASREQNLSGALSLEEERAKLTRAQRQKAERDAQIQDGKLVFRDDVIAETRAGVIAVRARFLQLPRQMVQAGIISRERELEVTALVNDALRELQYWRWVKADADDATAAVSA